MRTAQIAAVSPAVNRSQKKQQTLSWWARAVDPDLYWALPARGRYVARPVQAVGYAAPFVWYVAFRRRHKEEIVGTADSLTKAKDLAHADYDLARGAEARR